MTILAPGVAQLRIVGTVGSTPWNSLLYFTQAPGTAWTATQLTAAGNAIMSGMSAIVNSANFYTGLTWSLVEGVDIGQAAPALGNSTVAAFSGASPNEMTAGNCILINYPVATRYRGGKPRSYLPGMISIQQANANTWATTTFNSFVTAWKNAISAASAAVVSAGASICSQCVPTYNYTYTDVPGKHKYTKVRSSYKATLLVGSATANPTIRTQRRRLGSH